MRDRIEVAEPGARQVAWDGTRIADLRTRHSALRRVVGERLAIVDSAALPHADRRALAVMRHGLERATREVIEEFLGGPVTPAALLRDMARMKQ